MGKRKKAPTPTKPTRKPKLRPPRPQRKPEKPPTFIEDLRTRNICFQKRQVAFLKKAVHLSINSGSDIAIIVRRRVDGEKPPLVFASNGDIRGIFDWWIKESENLEQISDSSLLARRRGELSAQMQLISNASVAQMHWDSILTSGESNTEEDRGGKDIMIALPKSRRTSPVKNGFGVYDTVE